MIADSSLCTYKILYTLVSQHRETLSPVIN